MALSKLGIYIKQVDERNTENKFTENDVKGISTSKCFIDTKADLRNVNLASYKVVNLGEFAYVADTSRRGDKIGLAFAENTPCIISSIYTVFKVSQPEKLDPMYLMMYFNRSEFDRYARFNSWGSARETFSWEDMCDIDIDLPPIEIQRKYVAIYKALKHNLKVYQSNLDDLKLVCDAYIENLRKKLPCEEIGKYIEERTKKNSDGAINKLYGLTNDKGFQKPGAMSRNADLISYKCVYNDDIVYPPPHFGQVGTIGIFKHAQGVVSPMYIVFYVKDKLFINPDYLMVWFKRKEFMRYAFFASCDSIRDTFDLGKLGDYKIPIPKIEEQNAIAEIYNAYNKRKEFVDRLKQTINYICPVLIRGAIKEANGTK